MAFVYENGLPVGYDHLVSNYSHRVHGCSDPALCATVEQRMMDWMRDQPGQVRVRVGKIGIMQGQEPNLKRLDNE